MPPAWRVLCDPCAKAGVGTTAQAGARVTLKLSGPYVTAAFTESVPDAEESFKLRIAARQVGGTFSEIRQAWEVSLVQARALQDKLRENKLPFIVSPDLVVTLQSREQRALRDKVLVDERLARIEREIGSRGLELLEYQRDGSMWLAPRDAALLSDGPGSGKSVQAICSIPDNAPVVVICPASIMGVWSMEFEKWRPEFTCAGFKRAGFLFPQPGQVSIINYESTPGSIASSISPAVLSDELLASVQPGTILIADEAHRLKNPFAQVTKRFQAIRIAVVTKGGRCWNLTGDPIKNNPDELYYILQATGIEGIFGTIDQYRSLYSAVKIGRSWSWGAPSPRVATTLKTVMLRRPEEQILAQLPPMTIQDVPVAVWTKAHRECDKAEKMLSALGVSLEDVMDRAFEKKNVRIAFDELARVYAEMASAKLPAAIELVEDLEAQNEPVVVFSAHRDPVKAFANRPGWAMIAGGIDKDERTRIIKAFQEGQLKGLAMTIQAGGFGITTTRACNAIFIDEAWSPTDNNQARKRLHRLGQGRQVFIRRLVADHPLDRRIIEIQDRKLRLIQDVVEAATVPGKTPAKIPMDMTQEKLEEAKEKRVRKPKKEESGAADGSEATTEPAVEAEPQPVAAIQGPPPPTLDMFNMQQTVSEAGDEISKKKAKPKKKSKLTEVAREETKPEPANGIRSVSVAVDGTERTCPERVTSMVEARSALGVPHWFDVLRSDGSLLKPGDAIVAGEAMTTRSKKAR